MGITDQSITLRFSLHVDSIMVHIASVIPFYRANGFHAVVANMFSLPLGIMLHAEVRNLPLTITMHANIALISRPS